MLVRFLLPILLLIFVLSSCAREKGSESAPASNLPAGTTAEAFIVPSTSFSEAQVMARSAIVTCAAGETCSPSVGLLAFTDNDSGAQCTATLISEDTVITNAHCVPTELQKSNANCEDRIWMHFAKNDNPNFETTIGCSKILIAKGGTPTMESEAQADYALIKLNKKTLRPPLRLSRAGMREGEVLTLEKVNPVKVPGSIRGEQTVTTCRAAQNTYFIKSFNNDLASVAVIADCEARHGNSGSSLRASDGSIRGVLFAITEREAFKEAYNKERIEVAEPMARLNLASNLACLTIPPGLTSEPLSNACGTLGNYTNSTYVKLDAAASEQLNAHFTNKVQNLPAFSWFQWAFERPNQSEVSYEPTCVISGNVALGKIGNLGALSLTVDVKLDAYTRFEGLKLNESGGDQKVAVKKSGTSYLVKMKGISKTLKACEPK